MSPILLPCRKDFEREVLWKTKPQTVHRTGGGPIHRWRKRYAGMEVCDVRELKRLREENARLKKLVAERDLEVEVMKEIQATKW